MLACMRACGTFSFLRAPFKSATSFCSLAYRSPPAFCELTMAPAEAAEHGLLSVGTTPHGAGSTFTILNVLNTSMHTHMYKRTAVHMPDLVSGPVTTPPAPCTRIAPLSLSCRHSSYAWNADAAIHPRRGAGNGQW